MLPNMHSHRPSSPQFQRQGQDLVLNQQGQVIATPLLAIMYGKHFYSSREILISFRVSYRAKSNHVHQVVRLNQIGQALDSTMTTTDNHGQAVSGVGIFFHQVWKEKEKA